MNACSTVQDKEACDGKLRIKCDRGYRISHQLCETCSTVYPAGCHGGLGSDCGPTTYMQGTTCTPWPGVSGYRCVAKCDCAYDAPCPACDKFGSHLRCNSGECDEIYFY